MGVEDRLNRDLSEIAARVEELDLKQEKAKKRNERSQRREKEVHNALRAIFGFRGPVGWPEFAREWIAHWYAAAQVLRKHELSERVLNWNHPAGPSFRIAHNLFVEVLNGTDQKQCEKLLRDSLSKMGQPRHDCSDESNVHGIKKYFKELASKLFPRSSSKTAKISSGHLPSQVELQVKNLERVKVTIEGKTQPDLAFNSNDVQKREWECLAAGKN